jgi:hypothetical protein
MTHAQRAGGRWARAMALDPVAPTPRHLTHDTRHMPHASSVLEPARHMTHATCHMHASSVLQPARRSCSGVGRGSRIPFSVTAAVAVTPGGQALTGPPKAASRLAARRLGFRVGPRGGRTRWGRPGWARFHLRACRQHAPRCTPRCGPTPLNPKPELPLWRVRARGSQDAPTFTRSKVGVA